MSKKKSQETPVERKIRSRTCAMVAQNAKKKKPIANELVKSHKRDQDVSYISYESE